MLRLCGKSRSCEQINFKGGESSSIPQGEDIHYKLGYSFSEGSTLFPPIQAFTWPDSAYCPRTDEIRCLQEDMAMALHSLVSNHCSYPMTSFIFFFIVLTRLWHNLLFTFVKVVLFVCSLFLQSQRRLFRTMTYLWDSRKWLEIEASIKTL